MVRRSVVTMLLSVTALSLTACSVVGNASIFSDVSKTDEGMTAVEHQLAAGGGNTALCAEYIELCEHGLALCLQSNNAQTYADFCSALTTRCRTTVDRWCREADGGTGFDAGTPTQDAGATQPDAGPIISDLRAMDVTQSSANITWTLDEASTGQVEYGTSTAYGKFSVKETSFNYTTHVQHLSGLSAGTQYHFRVRSSNLAGQEAVSGDLTFTTAGAATAGCGVSHAPAPTSTVVVNVRDTGARGDGRTNDTAAIQAAVDRVAGTGGTVLVPDGTYMIDATANRAQYVRAHGVMLKSNMTFKMTSGAVLRAIPNNSWAYSVLLMMNATNVNIIGGTVAGERHQHLTPGDDAATTVGDPRCVGYADCEGQWGYCVAMYGSSNVYVEGVTARECWGDGFTIWGEGLGGSNTTLSCVVADDNRRQGLSIISGHRIVVRDSIFRHTYGHAPAAAIDVEPDATMAVDDVQILNNQFLDNHGAGVALAALSGNVTHVTVDGNRAKGNGWGLNVYSAWSGSGAAATDNTLTNNVVIITGRDRAGLYLGNAGTVRNTMKNNIVCGPLPFKNENAGMNTVISNTYNPTNCATLAAQ